MSVKGKYGYYIKPSTSEQAIYWDDETAWWLPSKHPSKEVWTRGGNGWTQVEKELRGTALVAPLPILFWEKE